MPSMLRGVLRAEGETAVQDNGREQYGTCFWVYDRAEEGVVATGGEQ